MSSTACQSTHDRAPFGRGFTLIEMMVVLVIFGVVMAIALPSYESFVRSGQEGAAKALLLDVAQKQAQYRTDRRGLYCCAGVTADEAGAEVMLTGLRVLAPDEVRRNFTLEPFYQEYQPAAPAVGVTPATPYLPAAFAFCVKPKSGAARGTRSFRIDQTGRRTVGVDCTSAAGGAANSGASTW